MLHTLTLIIQHHTALFATGCTNFDTSSQQVDALGQDAGGHRGMIPICSELPEFEPDNIHQKITVHIARKAGWVAFYK